MSSNATQALRPESAPAAQTGMANSFFGVAARAISGFSRAGIMLFIASRYGPTLFGKLALAISFMEVFRAFSEFGLDTVSIRRFSRGNESAQSALLVQVVSTKLLAATVCYAISMLLMLALAGDSLALLFSVVANLSLFSANLVGAFSSYYQSRLKMSELFPTTMISFSLYLLVSAALIFSRAPLVAVVLMLPACELLNAALLWRKAGHMPQFRFDFSESTSLLKESLPLGFMAAMVLLYVRLDNVFVFKFIGSAALGIYAAGFRIVEPVLMVPHAFSISLFTILSSHPEASHRLREALGAVLRSMWPAYLFVVCAGGVLVLWGKLILQHFGSGYLAAYPVLQILSLVLLLRTVNITLTSIINSRGQYSALAKITATNLAVNLVLAILLIPSFGIQGAAWAAFGTELWNLIAQAACVWLGAPRETTPVYGMLSVEIECE